MEMVYLSDVALNGLSRLKFSASSYKKKTENFGKCKG